MTAIAAFWLFLQTQANFFRQVVLFFPFQVQKESIKLQIRLISIHELKAIAECIIISRV